MNKDISKIVEEILSSFDEEEVKTESLSEVDLDWLEFDNSSPDLLYCDIEENYCVLKPKEAIDNFIKVKTDRITPDGAFNVNISHLIDHTLLKPEATVQDVVNLCMEAKRYKFASVCINPCFVKTASEILSGTEVKVCTVIGFPLGATTKEVKAFEAKQAIENGAQEIDMVINIGLLKSKRYGDVLEDIKAVRDISKGKILKVIIETCYLTEQEKIKACELSKEAGADYVKTSTGFGKGGATVEDILLMRKVVGRDLGVKASGGIRDFDKALEMVKAGATRIGASASVKIVNKEKSDSKGY